jgi:hypothetical protein
MAAHHRIKALGTDAMQRRRKLPARVVDQTINAAKARHDLAHHRFHALFVANIDHVASGQTLRLHYLLRYCLQLVQSAAHQHHLRAQAGQLMRGAAPHARACAGDDDKLPVKQASAVNTAVLRSG